MAALKRPLVLLALVLVFGCDGTRDGSDEQRKTIENKGSDTLLNVAQAWAEAYQTVAPTVAVSVSGGGSGTGIAALINGTVDLANASRPISVEEAAEAAAKNVAPREFIVGYDAVVVFVNRANPITSFTMEQLAEIFGENGRYTRWDQLGIEVPGCHDQEMILVSRQNNSGTYTYFRESVLGNQRDFRLGTHDMHGSKDVVDLVMHTPCAIGYTGLAYAVPEVKMPCVSKDTDSPCVVPSTTSAVDGSYAISRPLFMYTNGDPTGETKTYLDWILSDEGQCILLEKGYAALRPLDCRDVASPS
jgi:phosphate transport system substrate-binding protein